RILVFGLVVAFCAQDVRGVDQLKNFCRRFEHRTAVVNNKLYIEGGYFNAKDLGTNYTNDQFLYSDLLVLSNALPAVKATPQLDEKTVPSIAGGALWSDEINGRFYAFGGYLSAGDPSPFQTWTYDTLQSKWSAVTTTGDKMVYVARGMSAIAPDAGTAFYLGGYHDNRTDQSWTAPRSYSSSLVEFDMVNRKYTNHSGPNDSGRGEGLAVFVPASNTGLLIYFGGVVQAKRTKELTWQNIWIYDISLKKWYQQIATGDIPEARSRFCGAVAWPDDKSSYNIYLYGGLHQNGSALSDVYVLSLPAFVWVKLYSDSTKWGHHSMTCDIVNGTQMIVMGGTFPLTTECDAPETLGQHNVDLGTLIDSTKIWQPFNQNNPPYRVPDVLVKVIGGTVRGGANATGPATNQTFDKYLFEKEYKVPQRYATPIDTASATGTQAPDTSSANGPTRGLLIGVIVGALAGGTVIGIIAFYILNYMR
ncbi:hypothetical protein CC86DRAFT_245247, partial [Ophiobolus disseminans]